MKKKHEVLIIDWDKVCDIDLIKLWAVVKKWDQKNMCHESSCVTCPMGELTIEYDDTKRENYNCLCLPYKNKNVYDYHEGYYANAILATANEMIELIEYEIEQRGGTLEID